MPCPASKPFDSTGCLSDDFFAEAKSRKATDGVIRNSCSTACSFFVYHCFDRIVIHGYLSGLSRPEQVVHFVREVLGVPIVSKEVLSQRTEDYRNWVEAFARNHKIPIEWAEKGLR